METENVPEKTRHLKLISYKRKLILGTGDGHDLFKYKSEGGPFDRIDISFGICGPHNPTSLTQAVVYQAIKPGTNSEIFKSFGVHFRYLFLSRAQINDFVNKYNGCLGYHDTLFLLWHDNQFCVARVSLGSGGQMNTRIDLSLSHMSDQIITGGFEKSVHIVVPISAF